MNQTVAIGPLTFSVVMLLGLAGAVLGAIAGAWAGRASRVDVEPLLFRAAVIGFVAARLAFVASFHEPYFESPLSILDIRDGGWMPAAGFAAAAAYLVFVAVRRASLRLPLGVATATAATIWLLGAAGLSALPEPGADGLPALTLQDLEGREVALSEFHGKPTVVNLWATWCPPCRREMPVLREAQARRGDVNFVFLNHAESPELVRRFIAAQQPGLRNVLLDLHGQAGRELGSRALPTTFFFDAAGRLVDARVGELSPATLDQRLAAFSPGAAP